MSFLNDERGTRSSARLALWVTLTITLGLILVGAERAEVVWHLLETVVLALIGWAGGPRVFQYVAKLRNPEPPTYLPPEAPPGGV